MTIVLITLTELVEITEFNSLILNIVSLFVIKSMKGLIGY
jgi:hypothetical protein